MSRDEDDGVKALTDSFAAATLRLHGDGAAARQPAPQGRTTFLQRSNAAGNRREMATPPFATDPRSATIAMSLTRAQAAEELSGYLVRDHAFKLVPCADDILQAIADLKLQGRLVPGPEEEVKVLSRSIVDVLLARAGGLVVLPEEDVSFEVGTGHSKPDAFIMEAGFVKPGNGKVKAADAFAQCVGLVEWKATAVTANSAGQAAKYAQHMLDASPWRRSAVVIVYGFDKVTVYEACRWRHGSFGLRVLCSPETEVFEIIVPDEDDDDGERKKTVGPINPLGLSLLLTGVNAMESVRLSTEVMKALKTPAGLMNYANSSNGSVGLEAAPLGVGVSASACALWVLGRAEPICVKTVRKPYAENVATERKALEAVPVRPSFPRLLCADDKRLFTTPVVEPLLNSSDKVASRLGFAAYAPLVEDLGVMHTQQQAVFHCDIGPHNLAKHNVNGVDCAFLMDFGSAVIVNGSSQSVVGYSASKMDVCIANQILEALVEEGDSWSGTVTVCASTDLESLAKSIAFLEVTGVAQYVNGLADGVYNKRKDKDTWDKPLPGYRPSEVRQIWSDLCETVPIMSRMKPLFEAASDGNHAEMAKLLRGAVLDIKWP